MSAFVLQPVLPAKNVWNYRRSIGQMWLRLLNHVWVIRVRLGLAGGVSDLAGPKVVDVFSAGAVKERTSILQSKTKSPVWFRITEGTRKALMDWINNPVMASDAYLWPGRFHHRPPVSTRQYARF